MVTACFQKVRTKTKITSRSEFYGSSILFIFPGIKILLICYKSYSYILIFQCYMYQNFTITCLCKKSLFSRNVKDNILTSANRHLMHVGTCTSFQTQTTYSHSTHVVLKNGTNSTVTITDKSVSSTAGLNILGESSNTTRGINQPEILLAVHGNRFFGTVHMLNRC